jgi:hypothetical protein
VGSPKAEVIAVTAEENSVGVRAGCDTSVFYLSP